MCPKVLERRIEPCFCILPWDKADSCPYGLAEQWYLNTITNNQNLVSFIALWFQFAIKILFKRKPFDLNVLAFYYILIFCIVLGYWNMVPTGRYSISGGALLLLQKIPAVFNLRVIHKNRSHVIYLIGDINEQRGMGLKNALFTEPLFMYGPLFRGTFTHCLFNKMYS